ncbi:hypothetical protein [Delftia phage PhiW-14]|uniref:Uncharacterized protein n=1 Tax=Delftia phage PhiW-14 TaxID=665032 RepID=C9DGH6_BPW14|nr:hypothetical protein DP-phiW-14_gp206 [Delftia phage PhiW-14]ACV50227.1 hypothetical protein [Delftia phage PhiW-14]
MIRYHIVAGMIGSHARVIRLAGECETEGEFQQVMADQYGIAQNAKAHGLIKGKVIATRVERLP